MKNTEIIAAEAVAHGLYSQEQADRILKNGGQLEIFTVRVWQKKGYRIRKGEHARIVTDLWEMVKQSPSVDVKEGEIPSENRTTKFVLKKSYLFTADRVVPIEEEVEHGNYTVPHGTGQAV
ncbi:MAG: hypothetical protein LUD01_09745 [Clostridiales bacterium]|nr:hypothetical protein [Clostridiales bacterium]